MWVERIFKFDEDVDFMYKLHDEEISVEILNKMNGKMVSVEVDDEYPDEDEPCDDPNQEYDIHYLGKRYTTFGEYLHKPRVDETDESLKIML